MQKILVIFFLVLAVFADVDAQSRTDLKYDHFFLDAVLERQKGNNNAAFDLFRHCISIDSMRPEAFFFIAPYYARMKDKAMSLACYERAVKLNPDNETYQTMLALEYQGQMQNQKAIEILELLVERQPARADFLSELVRLYQREGDNANAIRILGRLELIEGKSERLARAKSELYADMGDKESSVAEIRQLAEQYPNDVYYKVLYAECLLRNGEGNEAMHAVNEVLAEEPANVHALMLARVFYIDNGEEVASDSITRIILSGEKTTADEKAFVMRQEVELAEQYRNDSVLYRQKSERIISLFELLMNQPQTSTELALLYVSYMDMKKIPREAMHEVVEKVLAIEPDNANARMHLVGDAWMKQDYSEVIRLCGDARVYNPDEERFYYYQGLAYFFEEDKDKALDTFMNGIGAIDSETDTEMASDFYMFLGDILHEKGRNKEAYAAYDSCLQWKPDNIGCLNNFAYFLALDGKNLDKAEEMSYKTIKAEPQNATYLDTYAWILFVQKRYSESKIYIEQALKNDTAASADMLEHAGDIYAMNNDIDKALEYWKKAAEVSETKSKVLIRKIKLKKYLKK